MSTMRSISLLSYLMQKAGDTVFGSGRFHVAKPDKEKNTGFGYLRFDTAGTRLNELDYCILFEMVDEEGKDVKINVFAKTHTQKTEAAIMERLKPANANISMDNSKVKTQITIPASEENFEKVLIALREHIKVIPLKTPLRKSA